jgi:hypothetical protein
MTEDIVASHLKSQRGRGQNQDLTAASTTAKSLPPIPNVGQANVALPADRGLTDQDRVAFVIKGPQHDPAVHDSMANSAGSPSGKMGPNNRPVTKRD